MESDSVQPLPRLRQELFRMTALAADALRRLGASVDSVDLGDQQVLGSPSPLRAAAPAGIGQAFPWVSEDCDCLRSDPPQKCSRNLDPQ